jgi:hypothetical protein
VEGQDCRRPSGGGYGGGGDVGVHSLQQFRVDVQRLRGEQAGRRQRRRVRQLPARHGRVLPRALEHICDGNFHLLEAGQYPLVDEACAIRPDGYYGASKAYGEALGSYYHDYHQLSSIHVRIGWAKPDNDRRRHRLPCLCGSATGMRRSSSAWHWRPSGHMASTTPRRTTNGRSGISVAPRPNSAMHPKTGLATAEPLNSGRRRFRVFCLRSPTLRLL